MFQQMFEDVVPDRFEAIFPARITAVTEDAGVFLYSWEEQALDPASGEYVTASPARSGDDNTSPAYEINNLEIDTTDEPLVWMRLRTNAGGYTEYEFDGGSAAVLGGSVTAEEVDGSPSYGSIHTLRFDSADGFVITNPATGVARVDIAAATQSQTGVVTAADQTFGGYKTFVEPSGVITDDAIVVVGAGAGIATISMADTQTDNPYSVTEIYSSKIYLGVVVDFTDAYGASMDFIYGEGFRLYPEEALRSLNYIESSIEVESAENSTRLCLHKSGGSVIPRYAVRHGATTYTGQHGTVAIGAVVTGGIITDLGSGGTPQVQDAFLDDIAALTDPGADRLVFWDDSAGEITWLTAGTGLTITGTTIAASGGTGDVVGPASAINNGIAQFDGTTGKLLKCSSGAGVVQLSGGAMLVGQIASSGDLGGHIVTYAKIQEVSALSILGNGTNATADVAELTAGTDGHVLRRSGTAVAFGTVATAGITDGSVTYAKIQDVSATSRLLGRYTAGSGDVEEISLHASLSLPSGVLTPAIATQSDQETATSTTVFVTPGRQHYHPCAAKAWIQFDGTTNTINASRNVTSITDNGTGDFTCTWDVDFSSAYYATFTNCSGAGSSGICQSGGYHTGTVKAAGSFRIRTIDFNSAADFPDTSVIAFGDQ